MTDGAALPGLAIWDTGPAAAALAARLAAAGAPCRLLAPESWPADEVIVVVAARYGLEDWLRWDHAACGRGASWMPVLRDGSRVVIGPLFRRGALCFSCLFRRLHAASLTPAALIRGWLAGFAAPHESGPWLDVACAECLELAGSGSRLRCGRLVLAEGAPDALAAGVAGAGMPLLRPLEQKLQICGLLGSLRRPSSTVKVLQLCLGAAEQAGAAASVFDASANPLPFCDGTVGQPAPSVVRLRQAVEASGALVFASPAYNGTFSALAKAFIEHLGPDRLTGKVAGCIAVSAEGSACQAAGDLSRILIHCGAWVVPIAVEVPFVQRVLAEPCLPWSRLVLGRAEALGRELVATARVHGLRRSG
jgi:NAD(P)H-dependent FMN reductase